MEPDIPLTRALTSRLWLQPSVLLLLTPIGSKIPPRKQAEHSTPKPQQSTRESQE